MRIVSRAFKQTHNVHVILFVHTNRNNVVNKIFLCVTSSEQTTNNSGSQIVHI